VRVAAWVGVDDFGAGGAEPAQSVAGEVGQSQVDRMAVRVMASFGRGVARGTCGLSTAAPASGLRLSVHEMSRKHRRSVQRCLPAVSAQCLRQ